MTRFAGIGLGLAAAAASLAMSDARPATMPMRPREQAIKVAASPRRSDPHDKKRKKTLRSFKRAMKADTRRSHARKQNKRAALLIQREREIGVHPKYRHRVAREFGPTPAAWERTREEWNLAHGLPKAA